MAIPTVHLDECPEPPAYVPDGERPRVAYCACCGAYWDIPVTQALIQDLETGAPIGRPINLASASYRLI